MQVFWIIDFVSDFLEEFDRHRVDGGGIGESSRSVDAFARRRNSTLMECFVSGAARELVLVVDAFRDGIPNDLGSGSSTGRVVGD